MLKGARCCLIDLVFYSRLPYLLLRRERRARIVLPTAREVRGGPRDRTWNLERGALFGLVGDGLAPIAPYDIHPFRGVADGCHAEDARHLSGSFSAGPTATQMPPRAHASTSVKR